MSNAINSISTRLNWKMNCLDFDSSEEEIGSILDDVFEMLKLNHEKLETLRIVRDNIERKNVKLTAETEEIKLQIAAMKQKIKLEKASRASLEEEVKRLKLDTFYYNALIAAFSARGLLPPDF